MEDNLLCARDLFRPYTGGERLITCVLFVLDVKDSVA